MIKCSLEITGKTYKERAGSLGVDGGKDMRKIYNRSILKCLIFFPFQIRVV